MAHVAVIGGGISGLAAAYQVYRTDPSATVTVVEQTDRPGGKLRTGEVAGRTVELGAEAFLVRDPAVPDLAAELGLGPVVHPAPVPARLAVGGDLHRMPAGTLMGIPADPAAVAGLATVPAEPPPAGPLLPDGADTAVGALVRRRFGDQVTDRLVDPLLGGVYAGRADDLSLRVTIPTLYEAATREDTLAGAVRAALAASRARSTTPGGPVFGAIPDGGMSLLVAALAEASHARLLLGRPVRALARTAAGWRLTVGSTREPEAIDADAVILAVPARPASRLLAGPAPAAAAEVGALDYAGVALVTLALPGDLLPASSGFLVPPTEGRTVKAATFIGRKWPHLADPTLSLLRASVGRYRDTAALAATDDELIALVRAELSALLRTDLPAPVDALVTRWGGGLPQYRPGHLDRVARARAALAPDGTLALAGAAYDGVGIPACVTSGRAAGTQVSRALATLGESAHGG